MRKRIKLSAAVATVFVSVFGLSVPSAFAAIYMGSSSFPNGTQRKYYCSVTPVVVAGATYCDYGYTLTQAVPGGGFCTRHTWSGTTSQPDGIIRYASGSWALAGGSAPSTIC